MPKIKVHFEHTLHFIKEMEITQEDMDYLTGNGKIEIGHGVFHNPGYANSFDKKLIKMIDGTEMDEAEGCTTETDQVFIEEVK